MKYRVKRHPVVQPPDQSIRLIPLTQGQNAIVDASDFEWLSQWHWCSFWDEKGQRFYAGNAQFPRMARLIVGVTGRIHVDHRNGDGLDNRRSNLRLATSSQNAANQRRHKPNAAGCKGVQWKPLLKKWRARICVNYKLIHIGYFSTKQEASDAYDIAARQHFGEFAKTNH